MFRWCVLTKVIYTLCIFKFVLKSPPVQVWLLCDPMMGWCIIRKQWLAPTSGSTVAHAAVCVLMVHIDALITSLIYTNPCNMMLNTSWIQTHNIIQMIYWCCCQHRLLFSAVSVVLLSALHAVANMRLLALARWRRVRRAQLVQNMTQRAAIPSGKVSRDIA